SEVELYIFADFVIVLEVEAFNSGAGSAIARVQQEITNAHGIQYQNRVYVELSISQRRIGCDAGNAGRPLTGSNHRIQTVGQTTRRTLNRGGTDRRADTESVGDADAAR